MDSLDIPIIVPVHTSSIFKLFLFKILVFLAREVTRVSWVEMLEQHKFHTYMEHVLLLSSFNFFALFL